MSRTKIGPEDSFLSITKNSETLIKQTHTKPQKTSEYKLNKPRETISFNPPISIGGFWFIALTFSEVYNSIFKITEEDNIFKVS